MGMAIDLNNCVGQRLPSPARREQHSIVGRNRRAVARCGDSCRHMALGASIRNARSNESCRCLRHCEMRRANLCGSMQRCTAPRPERRGCNRLNRKLLNNCRTSVVSTSTRLGYATYQLMRNRCVVRSRVMEKCTYCVQRIAVKISRRLRSKSSDGEIVTACPAVVRPSDRVRRHERSNSRV
jgi:hypothetical protein